MRHHLHLLEWLLSKRQALLSESKDMKKREPLCTFGGNVNWCSYLENCMEVSKKKIKNRLPSVQFSSVQLLSSVQFSRVQLFAIPWTAACQASLSIANSRSLLKLTCFELVSHPTILSSAVPFSSHLQSFPASGSFPMCQFFKSGGQSIGVSASTSVLLMNTQD